MKASFSILISASPTLSQGHLSAIRFIKTALKMGYQINHVFFYHEAVLVANRLICKPEDELQLTQNWLELSKQGQFELQVCVAAAHRRAVLSDEDAAHQKLGSGTLSSGFNLVGLGQLALALSKDKDPNHRQIHFK